MVLHNKNSVRLSDNVNIKVIIDLILTFESVLGTIRDLENFFFLYCVIQLTFDELTDACVKSCDRKLRHNTSSYDRNH